ncbi:MAG: hypothetical protein M3527_02960, partial [Actinomycetota bacterium]|nr:hypothetical protein [Actinomycetota bacterium]
LREAFAARDRLDARLEATVAEFEAAALYELDGAITMSSWLRKQAGRDPSTARKVCVTGRKLRSLPVLAEAALDGTISGGQLDVILGHVAQRHLERFAEQEAEFVPLLADLDVDGTQRSMELWRA